MKSRSRKYFFHKRFEKYHKIYNTCMDKLTNIIEIEKQLFRDQLVYNKSGYNVSSTGDIKVLDPRSPELNRILQYPLRPNECYPKPIQERDSDIFMEICTEKELEQKYKDYDVTGLYTPTILPSKSCWDE